MKRQKQIVILAILLIAIIIITIIGMIQNVYAKYVVNDEITIAVSTAQYYFNANAEKTDYIAQGEIEVVIDIKNYNQEEYSQVDINYTIQAINNNYNINIQDEKQGVLHGEHKENGKIILNATPKIDAIINPTEKIIVNITTKNPYVATKQIEINIDTRQRYTITYNANGGENRTKYTRKNKGCRTRTKQPRANKDRIYF